MGVVVWRYIDILTVIINFPYSTCISSFFDSSIPTSLFILKMFFVYIYKYSENSDNSTDKGGSLRSPIIYNYVYIYACAFRLWSNLVPRRAPFNAQRANVRPASNDSKVNNIAKNGYFSFTL